MAKNVHKLAEDWFRNAYSSLSKTITYTSSVDPIDPKSEPISVKIIKYCDEVGEVARVSMQKIDPMTDVRHRVTDVQPRITFNIMALFGLDAESAMKICADVLWLTTIEQPYNKTDVF